MRDLDACASIRGWSGKVIDDVKQKNYIFYEFISNCGILKPQILSSSILNDDSSRFK